MNRVKINLANELAAEIDLLDEVMDRIRDDKGYLIEINTTGGSYCLNSEDLKKGIMNLIDERYDQLCHELEAL